MRFLILIHNQVVRFPILVLEALCNQEMSMGQLASRGRLQQSMASPSPPSGLTPRGTGQSAGGAAAGTAELEEYYAYQLFELHELDFIDTRANIEALLNTSGNYREAAALLLPLRNQ